MQFTTVPIFFTILRFNIFNIYTIFSDKIISWKEVIYPFFTNLLQYLYLILFHENFYFMTQMVLYIFVEKSSFEELAKSYFIALENVSFKRK